MYVNKNVFFSNSYVMVATNAPGLAQLRMIRSTFKPNSKIVKKTLVFINHQNRNCSQADVIGKALCPGRLKCMIPTFF